jgi:tetratricopeptide (TPR) repeat protein
MAKKKLNKKVAIIVAALLVFFIMGVIVVILHFSKDPMKFLSDARAYVEQNDYEQAQHNYGSAFGCAKDTDLKIDILFEIAEFHLKDNEFHTPDWRKTAGCWNQIVTLDPKNLKARISLLDYFYTMADSGSDNAWQMVQTNASELIEVMEEGQSEVDTDILLKRARASLEIASTGQTDDPQQLLTKAKTQLEEILPLKSDDVIVYLYLEQAERVKGRIDEESGIIGARQKGVEMAKVILEKAAQAFPDNPEPHIRMLIIDVRNPSTTQEELLAFEKDYMALTEKFESHPDVYAAKSTYYRILDKVDKEIESLERAIELDGQNVKYILALSDAYYRKYSIGNDQENLTKSVATASKGLTLPGAQDQPGPLQMANRGNKFGLLTVLSHAYIDAAIDSAQSGDEGQRQQWLVKAQDSVHEIEQIIGTKANVQALKWQSQLALVTGEKNQAALQMYNVYNQLKAAGQTDALFSYRLARLFADSSEIGARLEFLGSALAGRISSYKPEVVLETAEVYLMLRDARRGLTLADAYESRYSATNRSIAVRVRALIGSGRYDDAQEELARLDADSRDIFKLKAELLRNRIRRIIGSQQNQLQAEDGAEADVYDQDSLPGYMREYLETLTKLLEKSHDKEEVGLPTGVLQRYIKDGKIVQAAGFINKYLEFYPDHLAANIFKKRLSEPDPANISQERISHLAEEVLVESDGLGSVMALIQYYRSNGQFDKAFQAIEKALQMAPSDEVVISTTFGIALQNDDMAMAEKMLEKARNENIDGGGGLTYAARIDLVKEDYQSAFEKIDEYIKLVPVSSYAYMLRSEINEKLGFFDDAISDIKTAYKFNPLNADVVKKHVALLYTEHLRSGGKSSQQQMEEINTFFIRAISLNTMDWQLQSAYAAFVAESDSERALSINQRLMKLFPNVQNALALYNMAVSIAQKEYSQSRKETLLETAEWACQEARKLEPDNKFVLQAYSNVLRLMGRQDEVAGLLEGESGQLWRFYLRDSQYERAKEILMALYQDDSQDADVLKGLLLVAKNTVDEEALMKYSEELLAADNTSENELLQIQMYLESGLVDEGALKLASFRERNPQNSLAMLFEAETMMKKGLLDEALELANRNLEAYPEDALAWMLRGRIKALLGDYNQAISDYQRSKSFNETAQIRMDLARVYQYVGKLTEAIGELTVVLESAQVPPMAREMLERLYKQTGRKDDLGKLYGLTLEKYPDNADWLVRAGIFYAQQDDGEQAEKLLERAWQLSLEQTGGRMQIFDAYLGTLGQLEKLDKLQAVASKYIDTEFAPVAYASMAEVKAKMGNRATAVDYYRKALDKSAGNESLVYGVLVNMAKVIGTDEAVRWCNDKLAEAPDSLPVITVLFRIYLMQGEPNKAMGYVNKAIDLIDPETNRGLLVNFLIEKSNILLHLHQKTSDRQYLDEAISVFEQLLVEQPKNASVLNNLAYILVDNNEQLDKAAEYAQRAHELVPDSVDSMDTYAYALCKTGGYEKANQLLQRAFQVLERTDRTPSWEFYEHLGMAQKGIGAIDKARNSYEKALETAGDNMSEKNKERLQTAIDQLAEEM